MFPKSKEKVNISRCIDKPYIGIIRQGLLRHFMNVMNCLQQRMATVGEEIRDFGGEMQTLKLKQMVVVI